MDKESISTQVNKFMEKTNGMFTNTVLKKARIYIFFLRNTVTAFQEFQCIQAKSGRCQVSLYQGS